MRQNDDYPEFNDDPYAGRDSRNQRKELEKIIVRNYQKDEQMMILVFAQWCINHGKDPYELYKKAYPAQGENAALTEAMELTVPKEEAGDIPDDTLLGVLSLFGNEDLAFAVTEEIAEDKRRKQG